jgi:hypothetical protein
MFARLGLTTILGGHLRTVRNTRVIRMGGQAELNITRRCERAVITAYTDLRQLGTDDVAAFGACTTLYRIHHPEASLNEARRLVAEWIDHHITRGDRGPTRGCDCP